MNTNRLPVVCPCPSIQRPEEDCNTPIDDASIKKVTSQQEYIMYHKLKKRLEELKKKRESMTDEYLPETDETRKIDSFLQDNWFVKRCKYCNSFVVLGETGCKYVKCHCRLGDPKLEICVACGFHTKTRHETHECRYPKVSYSKEIFAKQEDMIKKFEEHQFADIEAKAHEKKKSE